jgi:hypothetical protein
LCVGNRKIYEDLGISFFADHIRALIESFDWKVSWCREPLVWQLGKHFCQSKADCSPIRATLVNWCAAGQPRLSCRRQPSWHSK